MLVLDCVVINFMEIVFNISQFANCETNMTGSRVMFDKYLYSLAETAVLSQFSVFNTLFVVN